MAHIEFFRLGVCLLYKYHGGCSVLLNVQPYGEIIQLRAYVAQLPQGETKMLSSQKIESEKKRDRSFKVQ